MKTLIAGVAASVLFTFPVGAQTGVDRAILAARDSVWRGWFTNYTVLLHRFIPPAAAVLDGSPARWSDRKAILDDARGFASMKARLIDVTFENTEIQRTGG